MEHLVVRAFPVREEREDDLKDLIGQLRGDRAAQARGFYEGLGIVEESWHIQRTATGSLLLVVTRFERLPTSEDLQKLAEATTPFETWFKEEVERFSGVDLYRRPLGPGSKCIFEWERSGS